MDPFPRKVFGYAVVAIIAFYIMQAYLPYLVVGLIGWMVLRAFENHQKK